MTRSKLSITVATFSAGLAGCSSMPQFDAPTDTQNRPTVSTIVDKLECEIAEAREDDLNENLTQLKDFKPFREWTAAVTLTLTVDDSAGTATAGLPLSFIDTISKTSVVNFGLSPTFYQLRTRTYTQNYTINIADIPPSEKCRKMLSASNQFNLTGDLKIKDQIYMGLHAFHKEQNSASYYAKPKSTGDDNSNSGGKTPDSFGATVSFNVYYGVNNIGPTWTLATFKGPTNGIGYVRNDLHQIVITFAPTPLKPINGAQVHDPGDAPKDNTGKPPDEPDVVAKGPPKHGLLSNEAYNAATVEYMAASLAYANEVREYSAKVDAYTAASRIYDAKVQRYKAELAASVDAAAAPSALDAARAANQIAVTSSAIQSLGQILNRP